MHETSLVQSLFTQVAAVMREHGGASVERIRVEIGPLSGVEPMLVASAFDRLVDETPCRGASLRIEQVELSARCGDCGRDFVVEQFCFVCPLCASKSVEILRGDEFRLLDVTISDDQVPGEEGASETELSRPERRGDP